MTTIAFARGILASDSRITEKQMVWSDKCKKIWRLKDGSLFGASGSDEPGMRLLESLKKGQPYPKISEDEEFNALHIMPDGKIFFTEGTIWTRWYEPYAAIGSGKRYALTALHLGFDAVTAVKSGIKMDVHSGGRIQVLKLSGKK